jgi:hypothetical protein
MNFGQIHQTFFFSSLFFFLSLQDRPGDNLASHPSLLLSLMLFVPCKWILGRGAPEANLAQDLTLSLSLSPSPPCTTNQHHPTAQERPQHPTCQCLLEPNTSPSLLKPEATQSMLVLTEA